MTPRHPVNTTAKQRIVDLRSDTVTWPTEAMRRAMYEAEVGDDCYGEDPTVNRLQQISAEKLGKEAGLFVASGTMGNLCAVLAHTRPGQEVILGDESHTFLWEVGGISRIGGCVTHIVPFHDGFLDPEEVERAIRPTDDIHAAHTGLICVENTCNRGGGTIIPPDHLARLAAVARRHHIPFHMDGARIFNAAVGLDIDVRELACHVDSVMFCLSKGLSAPVGSVLVGSREFIARADQARKLLGGGMRQAGVLAAAGLVALEEGVARLHEDHANARRLAEGIAARVPEAVNLRQVQTNMVMVNTHPLGWTGQEFAERMARVGILFFPVDPYRVRLVTHRMVSAADIEYTLAVFDQVLDAR
jgi:threonine aldolase